MNRLGVFVFYDKQGVVDDYVLYLLSAMKQVCNEIVAICNGGVNEEGHSKLSGYCKIIHCRENKGMDAGALREFFTKLSDKKDLQQYDELVWFNDTCYGPLYPMKDVFAEMDKRPPCDFWGITVHAKSNAKWGGSKQAGIQEHLQSYFIVIKQKLLIDERFYKFWDQLKISDSFKSTVANYELSLTQTFSAWGYRYGVYCDTRDRDTNPDCVCNLTADAMYELVKDYACPFIKRKSFIRPPEECYVHREGEQVFRTVEYISKNKSYDLSLIYQNLMRLYEQHLWKNNLCNNFILSSSESVAIALPPSLIVAEVDHKDTSIELAEFLTVLPSNCELLVLTRDLSISPLVTQYFPSCQVIVLPERPAGLAGILSSLSRLDCSRYSYFCFLQELWGEPANDLHLSESSKRYMQYCNLVSGEHFIRNVLNTFMSNPLLGLLEPLPLNAANVADVDTEACLSRLGLQSLPRVEKNPVVTQPSLWCRKEIVQAVLLKAGDKLKLMEAGELESMISTFALSVGYYSANVTELNQAAILLEHQRWTEEQISDFNKLKYYMYQKKFHLVANINSGKLRPESSEVSLRMLFTLLISTAWYYVEKKIGLNTPEDKKESFFLGVQDVKNAIIRTIRFRTKRKP